MGRRIVNLANVNTIGFAELNTKTEKQKKYWGQPGCQANIMANKHQTKMAQIKIVMNVKFEHKTFIFN